MRFISAILAMTITTIAEAQVIFAIVGGHRIGINLLTRQLVNLNNYEQKILSDIRTEE